MKPACVLVVEDNAMNRRLVRDILEHRGHTVVEARDVAEARAQLARLTPDLVLLDIQIPGGGGELVLREIRRDPRLFHLPVLAVTALAMPGDERRLLADGFSGYLAKPIDTRSFGPVIESFLEQRHEREPE
jgi:two-component system cell cycle response regulator DivK